MRLTSKRPYNYTVPDWVYRDVLVFDTEGSPPRFLFVSRVHRQAIEVMCGRDSVTLLESRRAIEGSAWITTGGDALKCPEFSLRVPLMHEIVRDATEADVAMYFERVRESDNIAAEGGEEEEWEDIDGSGDDGEC